MNSRQSAEEYYESQLSILEIIQFLRGSWKIILLSGVSGITIAICYLLVASKVYEAKAQVVMAKIATNDQFNYQGISVEQPDKLINRLMTPSFLPANIKNICGVGDELSKGSASERTLGSFKLSVFQADGVEIRAFGSTQEAAINCANQIFELIKSNQVQLTEPYFQFLKQSLQDQAAYLNKLSNYAKTNSESKSVSTSLFLLYLDESRQVRAEVSTIKNILKSKANQEAHLVAPIYASDTPIAPRKLSSLMIGLFGGFLFGFICALGRLALINFKGSRSSEA